MLRVSCAAINGFGGRRFKGGLQNAATPVYHILARERNFDSDAKRYTLATIRIVSAKRKRGPNALPRLSFLMLRVSGPDPPSVCARSAKPLPVVWTTGYEALGRCRPEGPTQTPCVGPPGLGSLVCLHSGGSRHRQRLYRASGTEKRNPT